MNCFIERKKNIKDTYFNYPKEENFARRMRVTFIEITKKIDYDLICPASEHAILYYVYFPVMSSIFVRLLKVLQFSPHVITNNVSSRQKVQII